MQGGQPDYIVTPADLPGMQEINVSSMESKMIPPPLPVPIQGIYGRDLTTPGKPPDFIVQNGPIQPGAVPLTGAQLTVHGGVMQPTCGNNNYSGFDEQNQTIGLNTPLDQMYNQHRGLVPIRWIIIGVV